MNRRHALVASTLCAAGLAVAPSALAVAHLPGVRTSAGDVSCLYVPGAGKRESGSLLCQVRGAVYAKTLQAQCVAPPTSLDWHGFQLGATKGGAVVCSGGILYDPRTQRPSYAALPSGGSWRHGVFTCRAQSGGFTCTNRSDHGLFVSRRSWRAW